MSEIIVHGIPGSPFLRSVEIAFHEKRVDYRLQVISPEDVKGEAYLKLHPFGRIPVIEHGDFILYETQAIIRYIDQLYPEPGLTPADARAAARMNQIIGINDWYFFPKAAAPIGFQRVIGPALLGTTADESVIAAAMPMARTSIAELDRLLGDQPYLTGDTFSIADIMVGAQLEIFLLTPEGRELVAGTRLEGWLDRLRRRDSFAATEPPALLKQAA